MANLKFINPKPNGILTRSRRLFDFSDNICSYTKFQLYVAMQKVDEENEATLLLNQTEIRWYLPLEPNRRPLGSKSIGKW